ncbi:MAG: hypothetical protein ACOX63_09230 [Christensenellales bacterium]
MRTINQQIKEAESAFRMAGAGVDNFKKTIAGTESRLSMLRRISIAHSCGISLSIFTRWFWSSTKSSLIPGMCSMTYCLTGITLPEGLQSIKGDAFTWCFGLRRRASKTYRRAARKPCGDCESVGKCYFAAISMATATATVAPTMGLLPMPIRPIIST